MPNVQPHWIDDFFLGDAEAYFAVYLHRLTPARTAQEADALVQALGLKKEDSILDLACGHGRHAIELARRGYAHVTGLDYTAPFLDKAQHDSEAEGLDICWVHGDMRALAFDGEFDAVYNLFTALFYFDDETNQAVLDGIARSLRPGGRFLVDTNNALLSIRRGRGQEWEALPNGGWMLERWTYEPRTGRNEAERHIIAPDGRHVIQEFFVRQYTLPEVERMLRAAGLSLIAAYGDFALAPYGLDSARLIVVAERHN